MRARTIDFKRGGSEKDILDRILDRIPKGTLYFTSGRFPYLYMYIEPGSKKGLGIFKPLGVFRGGGRKPTTFSFYAPTKEEYEWAFDVLKPVRDYPKLWDRVKEVDSKFPHAEYFEEEYGIRPLMEANFERAKSKEEVKHKLFGEFRPGWLVTPKKEVSEITQSIGVIQDIQNRWGTDIKQATIAGFGYIFHTPERPPYFDGMKGMSGTTAKTNDIRLLTPEETKIVSDYVKDPKNAAWFARKKRDVAFQDWHKDVKIII